MRLIRSSAALSSAVLVASALVASAGATAAGASMVPASIPADCSRDVSADVNAWIAGAADGQTLTFAPGGCYRVDRPLRVAGHSDLVIDGNGSTFRNFTDGRELPPSDARARGMWYFSNGTNVTIRDTIVVGANPHAGVGDQAYVRALEAQTAYTVGAIKGMLLDHVQAYDVYGDFVFVGPAANGVRVQNSTFARNGRQGWTINGQNIVFDHNSISDTRRATVDLEPSSASFVTRHVTISNNLVGRGRLKFVANAGQPGPTDDVNIVGNRLVGKTLTIFVNPKKGYRTNYRIVGNTSDKPVDASRTGAIVLWHVKGAEIRDNVVPLWRWSNSHGVALFDSHDVSVVGNTFHFAPRSLVLRDGNTNVTQSGNLIRNPLTPEAPARIAGPT
jgi:hypothetical protein